MRIKIGARASDLSRIQAYTVGQKLKNLGHDVEFSFRESFGDQNLDINLSTTPEKGVFTQDFYQGLINGEYDMVVHSWKDLPTESRAKTVVVGTLPRADVRDVLLFKKSSKKSSEKKSSLALLSSSPRRVYNLTPFLKLALPGGVEAIRFEIIRGNVPTRIRKLVENPQADGLILAKAALDRMLGFEAEQMSVVPKEEHANFIELKKNLRKLLATLDWMVLPCSVNPSAAAQGALAIEVHEERTELKDLVQSFRCESTWDAVLEERGLLSSYGGGCHQKIGVNILRRSYGDVLSLKGLTDSGEVLNQNTLLGLETEKLVAGEKCFPNSKESFPAFDRRPLEIDSSRLEAKDLWIARLEALPGDYTPKAPQIVWTAGVSSWLHLAKRGIWVNGCAESLGENESEEIAGLVDRPLSWLKLSHEDGARSDDKEFLPTYKLESNDLNREKLRVLLQDKEYFFWKSGSQFLAAWEVGAEILRKGQHGCGPGHTYQMIETHFKAHGLSLSQLQVYLSQTEWQRHMGLQK